MLNSEGIILFILSHLSNGIHCHSLSLLLFIFVSSAETTNPVFGPTVNPHDTTRTAGGSSGGEAALIAGGGSILGFGSDIGGSLRIPAAMCGVCSLKPVNMRLPYVHLFVTDWCVYHCSQVSYSQGSWP